MVQVEVAINGRSYSVACDAGEEERIDELARAVDAKVAAFARQFPQAGEARLLLLAALTLADELEEARDGLQRAERGKRGVNGADEAVLAAGIDRLAQRIEAVAVRIETHHI